MDLKERRILSHPYEKEKNADKEPKAVTKSEKKRSSAVMTDHEGVYFHHSLLEKGNEDKDMIKDFIEEMWYAHTIEERILHGVTIPGNPHLFSVLQAKPNKEKRLIVNNVRYLDNCSKIILFNADEEGADEGRRGTQMEVFVTDIDTDSVRSQLLRLEMSDEPEEILKYHPYRISVLENNKLAEKNGTDTRDDGKVRIKRTINYPNDLLENQKVVKKKFDDAFTVAQVVFDKEYGQYANTMRKRLRVSTRIQSFVPPNIKQGIVDDVGYAMLEEVNSASNPQPPLPPSDPAPITMRPLANIQPPSTTQSMDTEEENPLLAGTDSETVQSPPTTAGNDSYWTQRALASIPEPAPAVQVLTEQVKPIPPTPSVSLPLPVPVVQSDTQLPQDANMMDLLDSI